MNRSNKKGWMICFLLVAILSKNFLIGNQEKPLISTLKPPFFIWGFSIGGFPITEAHLEQLEQETRIQPQLIQFYLQWPAALNHFDSILSSLEAISRKGAIASMTWEPMSVIEGNEKIIPIDNILKGEYDPYLSHMANEIKIWNKPLIIRFAHEMNIERYHWGGSKEQFNKDSPQRYIQMFRYVVNYFKNQDINQILWAFCPNIESHPATSWNTVSNFYPGDEYVDILGMDGYNWDITPEIAKVKGQSWVKPWASFEQLFEPLYQELKKIAPNKPILVFETASVDRNGSKKGAWIKDAIKTAKKWGLIGIVWFQLNKEEDWRINQHGDLTFVPYVRSATNPLLQGVY